MLEGVLRGFELWASGSAGTRPESWLELVAYIHFFRGFADRLHARKEQRLMSGYLEVQARGVSTGPAILMLHGHDQAHRILEAMETFLEVPAPWRERRRAELIHLVRTYVLRLRRNIEREEEVVFPMLEGSLSEGERESFEASVRELQRRSESSGEFQRLEALARRLTPVEG